MNIIEYLMYNQKTFLAIIPARGGSKRLPHKNILELGGKPLIGWSIEAAKKSKYIDKIIVSSDDEKILDIAYQFKAETLKRPDELASDTASTFHVIKHTIESIEPYDYIVLLQPTSPLRNTDHIDEAIELLMLKNADAIVSVCEMDHSPLWSNTLPKNGDMSHFLRDEIKNKRSQDLEKFYRLNGAIYICQTNRLLDEKSFFINDNIFAYIMDKNYSMDIDDKMDFEFVKYMLETSNGNLSSNKYIF